MHYYSSSTSWISLSFSNGSRSSSVPRWGLISSKLETVQETSLNMTYETRETPPYVMFDESDVQTRRLKRADTLDREQTFFQTRE